MKQLITPLLFTGCLVLTGIKMNAQNATADTKPALSKVKKETGDSKPALQPVLQKDNDQANNKPAAAPKPIGLTMPPPQPPVPAVDKVNKPAAPPAPKKQEKDSGPLPQQQKQN